MSSPVTVTLTYPATGPATDQGAPVRVCYLRRLDAVVTPYQRAAQGWRCYVLARRHPTPPECLDSDRVYVTDTELAQAATVLRADPHDVDGYVMAWLASVWIRYADVKFALAQALADAPRRRGTLLVDVQPAGLEWLGDSAGLDMADLHRLLDELRDAGLLTLVAEGRYQPCGVYQITLPDIRWGQGGADDRTALSHADGQPGPSSRSRL